MKILVTGAAGFLGKALSEKLKQGHEVCKLDRVWMANFAIGGIVAGDVRDRDMIRSIHPRFDQIYHLACPASPRHYQRDPIDTIDTAFNGTKEVLDLACLGGPSRVLIASTSEVYGDPDVTPQPETYWGNVNPYGPRSCYDEGKRAAEALAWAYERHRNLDIRIARIFNTYGPGMASNDGRVVTTFVRQAIRDESLTIEGNGLQTRSLCYIDDTIDGLIRLMNSEVKGPVNIGNPHEITIRALAETISYTVRPGPPNIKFVEAAKDDPRRRRPDISRALNELDGWFPQVLLNEGIEKTVAWYRSGK